MKRRRGRFRDGRPGLRARASGLVAAGVLIGAAVAAAPSAAMAQAATGADPDVAEPGVTGAVEASPAPAPARKAAEAVAPLPGTPRDALTRQVRAALHNPDDPGAWEGLVEALESGAAADPGPAGPVEAAASTFVDRTVSGAEAWVAALPVVRYELGRLAGGLSRRLANPDTAVAVGLGLLALAGVVLFVVGLTGGPVRVRRKALRRGRTLLARGTHVPEAARETRLAREALTLAARISGGHAAASRSGGTRRPRPDLDPARRGEPVPVPVFAPPAQDARARRTEPPPPSFARALDQYRRLS